MERYQRSIQLTVRPYFYMGLAMKKLLWALEHEFPVLFSLIRLIVHKIYCIHKICLYNE